MLKATEALHIDDKNNRLKSQANQKLKVQGQIIPTKSISDIVESITAVLYLDLGSNAAIQWLQVKKILTPDLVDRVSSFDPVAIIGAGPDKIDAQPEARQSNDQKARSSIDIEHTRAHGGCLENRSGFCDTDPMAADQTTAASGEFLSNASMPQAVARFEFAKF